MLNIAVANISILICVIVLGCIGIAAVLTTTSALVAQSTSRGGLMAALSFPLLTPLLLAGGHGTRVALQSGALTGRMVSFSEGLGDLQVLFSFSVITITASLLLFDFIWND